MILELLTPYGKHYKVNERGEITYGDLKPSGQWLLLGVSHVNRNEFIPRARLAEWLRTKPQLLYKNGHPQYTVRDLDHGTTREWGNTHYHGIKSIWVTE